MSLLPRSERLEDIDTTAEMFGSHEFAYEVGLRDVGDLIPGASIRYGIWALDCCGTYV